MLTILLTTGSWWSTCDYFVRYHWEVPSVTQIHTFICLICWYCIQYVYLLAIQYVYLLAIQYVYLLAIQYVYLLAIQYVYLLAIQYVYLLAIQYVYLLARKHMAYYLRVNPISLRLIGYPNHVVLAFFAEQAHIELSFSPECAFSRHTCILLHKLILSL